MYDLDTIKRLNKEAVEQWEAGQAGKYQAEHDLRDVATPVFLTEDELTIIVEGLRFLDMMVRTSRRNPASIKLDVLRPAEIALVNRLDVIREGLHKAKEGKDDDN